MEKIEMMDTPNTRAEFEYRFHLLSDIMQKGKLRINKGIPIDGILKVRYLPNGRIDFLSVDEHARCMANTILNMQNIKSPESIEEN